MTSYGNEGWYRLRRRAAALGIGLGLAWIGLAAQPLQAAERISVRFWEFERSLPVAALVRFARDGVVEPQLRWYLNRLSPADRQALRTALNQSVPVSAVMVANALSTDLGQHILQQLVKVLDGSAAVVEPALASALVLAAARQGELRLIEVLEAYPLEALRINAAAVLSLVRQLSGQLNLQNQLYPRLAALGGGPPGPGPRTSAPWRQRAIRALPWSPSPSPVGTGAASRPWRTCPRARPPRPLHLRPWWCWPPV